MVTHWLIVIIYGEINHSQITYAFAFINVKLKILVLITKTELAYLKLIWFLRRVWHPVKEEFLIMTLLLFIGCATQCRSISLHYGTYHCIITTYDFSIIFYYVLLEVGVKLCTFICMYKKEHLMPKIGATPFTLVDCSEIDIQIRSVNHVTMALNFR